MHAISVSEGLPGAVALARETGHSRLPIYDGNRDNITGILYVKDLLGMSEGSKKPWATWCAKRPSSQLRKGF